MLSDDFEEHLRPWRDRGYRFDEWSDYLFAVWLLLAGGYDNAARQLLIQVRIYHLDALATEQEGRIASRLFHRLGFSTDDSDAWKRLPDAFPVYRSGDRDGAGWTTDRRKAEERARRDDISELYMATVAKSDVVAFITGYGEDEAIVREGRLREVCRLR